MKKYTISVDSGFGADYTYLEWATEPPTKEGWYWARAICVEEREDDLPRIVKVFRYQDRFKVAHDANSDYDLADFTHWLGPLPAPELPE